MVSVANLLGINSRSYQFPCVVRRGKNQPGPVVDGRLVTPYPRCFQAGSETHRRVAREAGIALPHFEVGIVGVINHQSIVIARQVGKYLVVIQNNDVVIPGNRRNALLESTIQGPPDIKWPSLTVTRQQVKGIPRHVNGSVKVSVTR